MLFDNVTKHNLSLAAKTDAGNKPTIGYLVKHILDNLIKDPRKELFVQNDSM
jgi:ubiquitin related modifier 1